MKRFVALTLKFIVAFVTVNLAIGKTEAQTKQSVSPKTQTLIITPRPNKPLNANAESVKDSTGPKKVIPKKPLRTKHKPGATIIHRKL